MKPTNELKLWLAAFLAICLLTLAGHSQVLLQNGLKLSVITA